MLATKDARVAGMTSVRHPAGAGRQSPALFMKTPSVSKPRCFRIACAAVTMLWLAGAVSVPAQQLTSDVSGRPMTEVRILADRGDTSAMRVLANAYLTGEGLPKDSIEGVKWLRRAAELNDPLSQLSLAILHDEGRGVPKDTYETAKWLKAAADRTDGRGLPEAQYYYGKCHENGIGIRKDMAEAIRWFKKAAEGNDVDAQTRLGLAYIKGDGVEKNMVESANWLRKAAYQYDPQAQYFFGLLHRDGEGVPKDLADAAKWFRRAADQGYPLAQHAIGYCLLHGLGVTKDVNQATNWLHKAALQGQPSAIAELASFNRATAKGAPLTAPGPAFTGDVSASRTELPGVARVPSGATQYPELAAGSSFPRSEPGGSGFFNARAAYAANTNAAVRVEVTPVLVPAPLPVGFGDTNAGGFKAEPTPGFFSASTLRTEGSTPLKNDVSPPGDTSKETGVFIPKEAGTNWPVVPRVEGSGSKDSNAALPAVMIRTETSAAIPPPDPAFLRPGTREHVRGAMADEGNRWSINTTLAAAATAISLAMLIMCGFLIFLFKTRITSLEVEIKKTQFELSKANVNLTAMLRQVEALSLGDAHAPKQIDLPDWLREDADSNAKKQRPSAGTTTEGGPPRSNTTELRRREVPRRTPATSQTMRKDAIL